MNPWLILSAAILVEVAGTLCLKIASAATQPGGRVLPGIGVAIFYGSTLVLMAISMKSIDASTTYIVWSGVGMALITLASVVLFKESFGWTKLAGIALVAVGVMVLHSASQHGDTVSRETTRPAAPPEVPEA